MRVMRPDLAPLDYAGLSFNIKRSSIKGRGSNGGSRVRHGVLPLDIACMGLKTEDIGYWKECVVCCNQHGQMTRFKCLTL